MKKFLAIAVLMLVAAFALTGCNLGDGTGLLSANAQDGAEETAEPVVNDPTDNTGLLDLIEDAGITLDGTETEWQQFYKLTAGYADPYAFIQLLDSPAMAEYKMDHPQGGWQLITDANDVCIVWTGLYLPNHAEWMQQNGVVGFSLDGQTGVYLQTSGRTVTWDVPAGSACFDGYTGETRPAPGTPVFVQSRDIGTPTSCLATSMVQPLVTAMRNQNTLFVALDELVNANVTSRIRYEGRANVTATAYRTLIWTQPGQVSGNATELSNVNGKALYVATTDSVLNIGHAFSGVYLCEPLVIDGMPTPIPGATATARPAVSQQTVVPQTSACVPKNLVIDVISTNRGNEQRLYQALDQLAGQYASARVTNNAGTVNGLWLRTLVWVNDGMTGNAVIALDTSQNHSLWLFQTDGSAQAHASYTALTMCDQLNPAQDFSWWGS